MNYQQTIDFLFSSLPMYQRQGSIAFKKDLTNTISLCQHLDNPHFKFKCVHVAGTNGKGSSSHYLASVLQVAGFKTGLYTSPHLKNFSERIRINGKEISEEKVIEFVRLIKPLIEEINPSFFEITVAMAFWIFAISKVDIAIIETGLGGRLDSTNVIIPEVSLITNIGYDHQDMLGSTVQEIAAEKAGIIKQNVPVVIGSRNPEVDFVFNNKANETSSKIIYAAPTIVRDADLHQLDITPAYQLENLPGIIATLQVLYDKGFQTSKEDLIEGIKTVKERTGLKGRWQILQKSPFVVCDVAHNENGIELILKELSTYSFERLFVVLGMVKEKNAMGILSMFPKDAHYILCEPKIPRAAKASDIYTNAIELGFSAEVVEDVNRAVAKACELASINDFIYVGGSTFVVAELDNL